MSFFKISGYVVLCVIGLAVLGVVLLLLFFNPNAYKADIARVVEQKTHRKLTLQGDLKLTVFPWLAVRLGAAQLDERREFAPQDAAQPFVSVRAARLSVKLLPLLHGRIEIGDVQLIAPSIRLITDSQGHHNWDDLSADAGSETTRDRAKTSESGNVSATIAAVDIQEGEIILDNQRAQQRTALHRVLLQAKGIGSGKPFDLTTNFDVEQQASSVAHVQVSANISADLPTKKYALKNLDVQVAWNNATTSNYKKMASAAALPIRLHADTLTLDLAQQTLQLPGVQLNVGNAQLTGRLNGTDVLDAPQFKGHLVLAALNVRELLQQLRIDVPVTRDSQVLKQLSFDADIAATRSSIALQKLQLHLDDSTARGELAVVDVDSKALRVDLNIDRIDFDRYLPPQAAATQTSTTTSQATAAKTSTSISGSSSSSTPIPVAELRALNLRGNLRVSDATFANLKLSQLSVSVTARDGDIHIAPATADLYGGHFQAEVALDVANQPSRLTLAAQVSNVQFASFLHDMLDVKAISGRGNLNVHVNADGNDTQALLKAAAGTLDFKVADGAYEGVDLWYEIRRARAVLHRESIPARNGTARTAFTAIQGTGVLHAGVLDNRDLSVASQYLKIAGAGQMDFVHGTLDYRLNAKVLRIPDNETQAVGETELVDAEIPLTVNGDIASPTVRPDIASMAKTALKQKLNEQKGKLEQKLQDTLQDKLKNLLSR